ncbi:D-alanyl-D-alanine carboxypeptidase [Ruminiclostridium herbifermentans]|uniref:serine-type D-Ala-D-Ala carboxypeptidase n=1 Tax=Ruminiclostridium herbifermentans TaxID=2488810 RepID=A0A4U7JG17_9FIRM|nr:D-alanyl-D-alanine carboxypeptidase family protein [Ruminiclostridium herbifermentans]QNU65709.1 D-alanyl-D-alanine carboxypeptidase [Ruminiclostridium herbifermentans]
MLKTFKILLLVFAILINMICTNLACADDINDDEPIGELFEQDSVETMGNNRINISAGAAIVMDTVSGRVLYEKNAYKRSSIASTTKIMTAIVALENGRDDEDVVVSKRAASISGSQVNLQEGKTYKLGDLMYAMMLRSGNDAAIAIAEHIGGSIEAFAEIMNRKAAEIGATNTNFVTPHGLDNPQHFSTPYDLALITQYALRNEKFCKIVGTKNAIFLGNNITNTNEMLSLYPGADGVKTGYTGQAGRCLVTSATQNGWRIIAVVLNCSSRSTRAKNSKILLDYAFGNYKSYEYLKEGQEISEIKVHKGLKGNISVFSDRDISIPLKQDEVDKLQTVYNISKEIEAPVKIYSKVGTIDYILDGKILASADIITHDEIDRKDFYYYFNMIFKSWTGLVRAK